MEFSTLRLYVDSANTNDWEKYLPTGIFYGVTTNPTLLKKSGVEFKISHLAKLATIAFNLGADEIHIQMWSSKFNSMLKVGRELARIDQRVMIKVPINLAGILCARQLIAEGANTTRPRFIPRYRCFPPLPWERNTLHPI